MFFLYLGMAGWQWVLIKKIKIKSFSKLIKSLFNLPKLIKYYEFYPKFIEFIFEKLKSIPNLSIYYGENYKLSLYGM